MDNGIGGRLSISRDVLSDLVDIVCESTGLSIALVEVGENRIIHIPPQSERNFPVFCKAIWSTSFGLERCQSDHVEQAQRVKKETVENCHAGLISLAIPIEIRGDRKAVLLCGQCRPSDPDLKIQAERNLESFLLEMGKVYSQEESQKLESSLRRLYMSAKAGTSDNLKELTKKLSRISNWVYWAYSELDATEAEKHEIRMHKDHALPAAKLLIHDMTEPIQRVMMAASILHEHAMEQGRKESLLTDITFLRDELEAARDILHEVHRAFGRSVKPPAMSGKPDPIDEVVLSNLLEVFCESTDLAIGLFESTEPSRKLFTQLARSKFTPYCCAIQETEEGRKRCDQNHVGRAKCLSKEGLSLCYAGLWEYGIPIQVGSRSVATLLCGQRRLKELAEEGERWRDMTLSGLTLSHAEEGESVFAARLRNAYHQVELVEGDYPHLERLGKLARLSEWMYAIHEQLTGSTTEKNQIIADYRKIVDEEEQLHHDICSLLLQAVFDVFAQLQHSISKSPTTIAMASKQYSEEILDILEGARHRLWYSMPAQFLWRETQRKHVNLLELLDRCVASLSATANWKNVSFEFTARKSVSIHGNYYELFIAFWNILQNAVKYSHWGFHRPRGMKVLIGMEVASGTCQIWVQNFGIGILAHEDGRIYAAGERGELAKRERPHGLGRGLQEAKEMFEKNGCNLSHRSTKASDSRYLTTFYIDVPL
jgi:ligand-binding sensor protein